MTTLPLTQRSPQIRPLNDAPSTWTLGCLRLSFGAHGRGCPPCQGADLLVPRHTPLLLHQETVQRILRPPLDLLYLPAGAHGVHTSPFHGWKISLDPEELCRVGADLAEHQLSPGRFRRSLRSPHLLQAHHSPARQLVEALQHLIQVACSETLLLARQLEQVGLDRAIARLLVLLLCGDQIEAARERQQDDRGCRKAIFDELLQWIEAHLDQPMQLRDLAEQSGYSERSLRNFFQERFGCGPTQWIRSRRLEAARERLLSPRLQDSLSLIASSVGYSHLSQFSRDFHSAYGCKPSALLREGLRQRDLEPGL